MIRRTFIAVKIPVSKQTAEKIQDIKSELQNEKIKWVEIFNMHITLFFVGNTDEKLIQNISFHLNDLLKSKKSFILKGKGIGVFKNLNNPLVLWLGIEESEYLEHLKLEIDRMMEKLGFEIEGRKFKPHLTLGRIKYLNDKRKFKNVLNNYEEIDFQDFDIDKIFFYESKLTPDGPVYKVIKQINLY
ncbi:MAG TPA: RNA 2',3'-cyclic phosphodiesterase [Bacteroidales bacterium]|nr:RNA 2',3'-cyclic phosphodiesterase [Bacteroidales bacterium]